MAELKATIDRYRHSIFKLLQSYPASTPLPDLTARYDELWQLSFPIISGLANLITHLGGETISSEDVGGFTRQAETAALVLHTNSTPAPPAPPHPDVTINNDATKKNQFQATHQDSMTPPEKPKSSLKEGKFFPARTPTPPPLQVEVDIIDTDGDEDDNNPSIFNHTIDGIGDGTHLMIASFIMINDKIRDHLVTNFGYFSKLMHANIDGLQIHQLNTDKPLPILTSPTNKNISTTGTKVMDYFYIQNSFSLIPGTHNKPNAHLQKVGDDGQFQFDENHQYDGPNGITGVMSVSTSGNVKQAIGDLLIKLEGDAHQIKYKPTQRKNSKAEKMFPGVPAGLCSEGLMRSIRHGLKNYEKTLCNAKKFTIKANMDRYHLPLPVMNGYFKQFTPPKTISDSGSGDYSLNTLMEFKKNGCKTGNPTPGGMGPQFHHQAMLVLQALCQL